MTQPAQSPHFNINDLGFFASLKSRVRGMNASTVDELVQTIFDQYEEYDGDTLERVWQSLKAYNQTLRKLGDNDFSVEHTGVRKRQREGTLERVVKYDVEAFKTAWDYLADEEEEAPPPSPGRGSKTAIFGLTHFFQPWAHAG